MDQYGGYDQPGEASTGDLLRDECPAPINWNLLTADEAQYEWQDLDQWVQWLRNSHGLPPSIVPPFYYLHDELVWELSALHTHWLSCYHPTASPSAPIAWRRDFEDAKHRLRDWVSISGTRLDRDRPTRVTAWPGEDPAGPPSELEIDDRERHFKEFVRQDVLRRRRTEEIARQSLNS